MTDIRQYHFDGKNALRRMRKLLEDIWRQNELGMMYGESIESQNKKYQNARDAAMALGEDVSKYPRRLKWSTPGLEIIERI